MKHYH